MPYQNEWYIIHDVILSRYCGVSTLAEVTRAASEMRTLMDLSPKALIHVIIDVGDVTKPLSLKESLQVARDGGTHPKQGWTIFIGVKSGLMRLVTNASASIFKWRVRTFDDLDQAIAFLLDMDLTIPRHAAPLVKD